MKKMKTQFGKTLTITLLASALIAALASLGHASPIIGGDEVSQNDPVAETTVALMMKTASGMATCTGSIIAQDIIVTAAHCLIAENGQPLQASDLRVIFGTNLNDRKTISRVAEVIGTRFNPAFPTHMKQNYDHSDIGVIRFKGGLPAGFGIAALLPRSLPLRAGMVVELAGYGISNARADSGDGILRKTDVQLASKFISKSEVAVDQRAGKGACHGDSGGPAFVTQGSQHYLFGVTSRGDVGDRFCDTLGIYTLISAHTGFLRQSIGQLRALNALR
ncbi:MAG: trypsin-like serine protease [Methylotenera sp.]|nr:trypsin-like serine protease [Oligoflexia bacterium]